MLRLPPRARHAVAAGLLPASLAACADPGGAAPPAVPLEPVSCYRTLADASCRTSPDPGRAVRLVGVYLRDSDDPAWPDWWLRRAGEWP